MAMSAEEMAVFLHLKAKGDPKWNAKMADYVATRKTTPDTDALLLAARMRAARRELDES